METIFDHNPTDLELKRFGGREHLKKCKKHGIERSSDTQYYMIGLLYSMRGDKDKANDYWSRIENKEMLKTLIEDF